MNAEIRKPLARIRQDVQSMHAYAVQGSTGMLKLDAMENPHRLSPELQADLGRRLGAGSLLHGVVGESLSGALLLIGDLLSLLGYRRQSGILSSLLLYGLCLDGHFTRNGVDIDWGGNR